MGIKLERVFPAIGMFAARAIITLSLLLRDKIGTYPTMR
jgi:hypothetical protein